jgi:hypothetical protein
VTVRWNSPGTPVSSTNKSERHDIAEISLNVALNITKLTNVIFNKKKKFTKQNVLFQTTDIDKY